MDDANHHLPDDGTGYLSENDFDQPEDHPGVNNSELTQVAPHQRPSRKYAIPDADPLDLTVGALPTRYEPPVPMPRASAPVSPSLAIPIPQPPAARPLTPTYFPPPPPRPRTGMLARSIWLLMGASLY